MKELIREYQSVLITSISAMLVFIVVYTALPIITDKAVISQNKAIPFEFIEENNSAYNVQLLYPKGQIIRITKGAEFNISDYILINDQENGNTANYEYSLIVDGMKCETFNTNLCGGFSVYTNITYKGVKLKGKLLVIIEER